MQLILLVIISCIVFLLGFFIARAGFNTDERLYQSKAQLLQEINKLDLEKTCIKDLIKSLEQEEAQCRDSLQQAFDQMTEAQEKHEIFLAMMEKKENSLKAQINNEVEEERSRVKNELIGLETLKTNTEQELSKQTEKLNQIKTTIAAGEEAIRQQALSKDELKKYQLQISEKDLSDIKKLFSISEELTNPRILYMLIWSTYFQKETKDLCKRVGVDDLCGIYKITDLTNDKSYIGQSVKISDRWVSHIKKGLGIDTPTTNALYKGMRENGVWNFTFSLLEECGQAELDECERKWIEIYNSNNYGYNSTRGNQGGK